MPFLKSLFEAVLIFSNVYVLLTLCNMLESERHCCSFLLLYKNIQQLPWAHQGRLQLQSQHWSRVLARLWMNYLTASIAHRDLPVIGKWPWSHTYILKPHWRVYKGFWHWRNLWMTCQENHGDCLAAIRDTKIFNGLELIIKPVFFCCVLFLIWIQFGALKIVQQALEKSVGFAGV